MRSFEELKSFKYIDKFCSSIKEDKKTFHIRINPGNKPYVDSFFRFLELVPRSNEKYVIVYFIDHSTRTDKTSVWFYETFTNMSELRKYCKMTTNQKVSYSFSKLEN